MIDIDKHVPDKEEISDAQAFFESCSETDLLETWTRCCKEWDLESVIKIHRFLCESGRIDTLLSYLCIDKEEHCSSQK